MEQGNKESLAYSIVFVPYQISPVLQDWGNAIQVRGILQRPQGLDHGVHL